MATRILILEIEWAGFDASVQVNRIAVVRDSAPERVFRTVRISGWCVAGDNSLLLAVQRPPAWKDPQPRLVLRLRDTQQRAPDPADRILVDYRWDPAAQPVVPGQPLVLLNQSFSFVPPAQWSWTRADAVSQLSPADRAAIAGVLDALQRALAAGAIPQVLQLQATQLREQALAVGARPGSFEQSYAEFLQQRIASPSWTVQPLQPERLQITPMAGGRIHHVAGPGGAPALVARSDGGMLAIEPYLARVDGRWSIVR